MSLWGDLLQQAKSTLNREPQRPRQASLRRAVSTAYYALFHLLVEDGALAMFGGYDATELRNVVRRAYDHATMKQAAKGFASGQLANIWQPVLSAPSPDLELVANAFVELQEARLLADYDPRYRLTRDEARDLVDRAENAIQTWQTVRKGPQGRAFSLEARVFLAAVLMHKEISRR